MRVEPRCGCYAEDIFFAVKDDGARRLVGRGNAVYEDHCVPSGDAVEKVQSWCAEIRDFYIVAEVVARLEEADYVRSNSVVS